MISPFDVIYLKCVECNNHLTWKVCRGTFILGACCCGKIYNAMLDKEFRVYSINIRDYDQKNVVSIFNKKNAVS